MRFNVTRRPDLVNELYKNPPGIARRDALKFHYKFLKSRCFVILEKFFSNPLDRPWKRWYSKRMVSKD